MVQEDGFYNFKILTLQSWNGPEKLFFSILPTPCLILSKTLRALSDEFGQWKNTIVEYCRDAVKGHRWKQEVRSSLSVMRPGKGSEAIHRGLVSYL